MVHLPLNCGSVFQNKYKFLSEEQIEPAKVLKESYQIYLLNFTIHKHILISKNLQKSLLKWHSLFAINHTFSYNFYTTIFWSNFFSFLFFFLSFFHFKATHVAYGGRGQGTNPSCSWGLHHAMATMDPSHICDPCCSLRKCWKTNPLARPGMEPISSQKQHCVLKLLSHSVNPQNIFLNTITFFLSF